MLGCLTPSWRMLTNRGGSARRSSCSSFRDAFNVSCSDELLGDAYSDIFWPNTEVCALVPRLKPRYRLLVGSNTTELHALRFQREFADTLRHFDAVVLSYQIQVRKPKAGFFEHCRRLAHCAGGGVFVHRRPTRQRGRCPRLRLARDRLPRLSRNSVPNWRNSALNLDRVSIGPNFREVLERTAQASVSNHLLALRAVGKS